MAAIQPRWGPRAKLAERITTGVLHLFGILLTALGIFNLALARFFNATVFVGLGGAMLWAAIRGMQLTRAIPVDDEGYPIQERHA